MRGKMFIQQYLAPPANNLPHQHSWPIKPHFVFLFRARPNHIATSGQHGIFLTKTATPSPATVCHTDSQALDLGPTWQVVSYTQHGAICEPCSFQYPRVLV